MVYVAPLRWDNRNISITGNRIPESTSSISNSVLMQRVEYSIENFYGSSQVLLNYSLPFALDTSITIDSDILEKVARNTLRATLAKVQNLLTWEANWNSYKAIPPKREAVIHAKDWIISLFLSVETLCLPWIKPNVTASPDGDVVFEWWHGKKKLTVYVGDQSAEYVQVWGSDIDSEMSDGDAESIQTCQSLWEWLISNA